MAVWLVHTGLFLAPSAMPVERRQDYLIEDRVMPILHVALPPEKIPAAMFMHVSEMHETAADRVTGGVDVHPMHVIRKLKACIDHFRVALERARDPPIAIELVQNMRPDGLVAFDLRAEKIEDLVEGRAERDEQVQLGKIVRREHPFSVLRQPLRDLRFRPKPIDRVVGDDGP